VNSRHAHTAPDNESGVAVELPTASNVMNSAAIEEHFAARRLRFGGRL